MAEPFLHRFESGCPDSCWLPLWSSPVMIPSCQGARPEFKSRQGRHFLFDVNAFMIQRCRVLVVVIGVGFRVAENSAVNRESVGASPIHSA